MPNVRRLLVRHGVTFTNFFVTTSECCPSRASILSGQYSRHTGVYENFGPRSFPAFRDRSTLATWLSAAGYSTALIGKYLNSYPVLGHHRIPPGWSEWDAIDSAPENRYHNFKLNENGRLVRYRGRPDDYSTTVLTDKALRFIDSAPRPFFLYLAPVAPHLPAIPAPQDRRKLADIGPPPSPSFNERELDDKPWQKDHRFLLSTNASRYVGEVRRRQLESLFAVDRSVAAIVRALAARRELQNTIIAFTSDNGFLWGEHRLGGKIWPYEESIRVPLVVRVPWARMGGTADSHLALNIDLAPTLAALAGARPGIRQDGRSLVPLLTGKRTDWRTAFIVEYLGGSQLRLGGPPPFEAIHTLRYVYVEYGNGWRELYDLRADPFELHNLASEQTFGSLQSALTRRLHAVLRE